MNQLFSSALIFICALGIKLRTSKCGDWKKSVIELEKYIGFDIMNDADLKEFLTFIDEEVDAQNYGADLERELIMRGLLDVYQRKMKSDDLIPYFEKLVSEEFVDEKGLDETSCWLKDVFNKYDPER